LDSISQTSSLYSQDSASTGATDNGTKQPTTQQAVVDYTLVNYLNVKEDVSWTYRYTLSSSQVIGNVSVVGKVSGIKYDAYELLADANMVTVLPRVFDALEGFTGTYFIAWDAGIAYMSADEASLTESFDSALWSKLPLPKELKASATNSLSIINGNQTTLIPDVATRNVMASLEGHNGAGVCFVEDDACAAVWVLWPEKGLVYADGSDGGYLTMTRVD
jgi:hypothetical protein